MFERTFQWTTRHGSRILFAMALVIFVVQIAAVIIYAPTNGGNMSDGGSFDFRNLRNWGLIVMSVAGAFQSAALPLGAALIVESLRPKV